MEKRTFNVGQYVVYGSDGVCEVVYIGKLNLPDISDDDYYFLRPLDYDGMIYAPVDARSRMRPVIDRQKAQSLINGLSTLEAGVASSHDKKLLSAHYDRLLAPNTCEAYARTVKSICKKRTGSSGKKTLSAMEEQLLKKTEQSLLSELSVALDMPVENVRWQVEGALMN